MFARWAVGVVALGGLPIYLAGAAPVASQQARLVRRNVPAGPQRARRFAGRRYRRHAGPRFGGVQYRDHDFLQDGEVVLTFDDGPHPDYTVPILDALDEHCVKATFYMVGRQALAFPKYAREVGRRGHTIGTHTWSHRNLARSSAEQMRAEIELGISAVQLALGGPTAPFFRFPYLAAPNTAQHMLQQRDTANVSIDVDCSRLPHPQSGARMISNVLNGLQEQEEGHHPLPRHPALDRARHPPAPRRTENARLPRRAHAAEADAVDDRGVRPAHRAHPHAAEPRASRPGRSPTAASPRRAGKRNRHNTRAPSLRRRRPPPRARSVDDWRRSVFGGGN